MSKTKSIVISVFLAIVTITVAVFTFGSFNLKGTKKYTSVFNSIEVGAELKGSCRIDYSPTSAMLDSMTEEDLEKSISIVRNRLDLEEFSSAVVYKRGNGFSIEYPKSDNLSFASTYFYKKGVIGLFVDSQDWFEYDTEVFATNPYLEKATVSKAYEQDGVAVSPSGYSVVLHFTKEGKTRFYNATSEASNNSSSVMIVLDGDTSKPLSQASVSEPIKSDTVQISGNYTKAQAQIVASIINNGVLPIEFFNGEVVEITEGENTVKTDVDGEAFTTITSVLGKNASKRVIIAIVVAFAILMILLGVFYRGFGIVADISLLYTVLFFVLLYSIIPGSAFTGTAIIGLIFAAVLFTVISVTLFESAKKEFANGKTVNFAISSGFKKCALMILDIAILCAIAYFGSFFIVKWAVRPFFEAFAVAGLLSCFTASVLTRGIMLLFKPLFNQSRFYNLNREETDND